MLFDLTREINRARRDGEEQATHLAAALIRMEAYWGILQDDPKATCAAAHRTSRAQRSGDRGPDPATA